MILAVNIGNTNIALGVQFHSHSMLSCRFLLKQCTSAHMVSSSVEPFLAKHNISPSEITDCIVSSVVPEKTPVVVEGLEELTRLKPTVVTTAMDFFIDISQYDCSLVGVDRLLCCMASRVNYNRMPCIVFDLGTATTANVIDKMGNFLGGAIIPGVEMNAAALRKNAALLSNVTPEANTKLIGKNTGECIQAGIVFGTAGFIESYVSKVNRALGIQATVVITGGNAQKVMPYLEVDYIYNSDLLLEGLMLLSKVLEKEGGKHHEKS